VSDTIEQLRRDLETAGIAPDQVQSATAVRSWGEGTYVCGQEADGYVVRQFGRGESNDRRELFATEDQAMASLRGRLLGTQARAASSQEQAEIRERMQRRAEEIKASIRQERAGE